MAKQTLTFLLLFLATFSYGQQIKVDGYFLKDSAKLGERVGYVLKAEYPESSQLLFPDSSFTFEPQVLLEKQTFSSSTQEGVTTDSAVYFLSNFSLDPSIFVSLPVYEILRFDSISHFPLESELKLKLTIDSIPEQLQFKENNIYQPLEKGFNWIYLSLWLGGVVVFLGIFYLLFAKRIKRIWEEKSESKKWKRFEKRWSTQTSLLEENPSIKLADEVISLWKLYMESLTKKPFQEWTSSEISLKLDDPKIFDALRAIDVIIYAGHTAKSKEATDYLLKVASTTYHEKISQIKHERAA